MTTWVMASWSSTACRRAANAATVASRSLTGCSSGVRGGDRSGVVEPAQGHEGLELLEVVRERGALHGQVDDGGAQRGQVVERPAGAVGIAQGVERGGGTEHHVEAVGQRH